MASSAASSESILDSKFATWESTLKDVTNSGYASSEETLNTNTIAVFASDKYVCYREHSGQLIFIKKMSQIPGRSMHFPTADKARYAGANSLETARVEALTRAIYAGSIKITGRYACVNHIGTYPSDDAPELFAETPVPIKLDHGQVVKGILGYHEVIVAKDKIKKIYVCHIKPEYSPSDNARELNSHRIYFAGALPLKDDPRNDARIYYNKMQDQDHFGTSRGVLRKS